MYYLNKRDITLGHEMVNLIWIIHSCCFTQQYGCYIICHKLFINTWLQRNNYKWKSHDDDSPCLLPTNSTNLRHWQKNVQWCNILTHKIRQRRGQKNLVQLSSWCFHISNFLIINSCYSVSQFMIENANYHKWWKKLISVNWNHLFLVINNDKYVLKYVMILLLLHGSSPSI